MAWLLQTHRKMHALKSALCGSIPPTKRALRLTSWVYPAHCELLQRRLYKEISNSISGVINGVIEN